MKAKFTDRLRLFFVSLIVLNLVLTPNISYALAPKSHIGNILKSVKLMPASMFHRFLFKKQLTFTELYNEMHQGKYDISPDSLLDRLKHEISKKRIVPVLNKDKTVSFKLKNPEYDKNLMWIFVPQKHMGKTIHADGYIGSRSLKGTVVAVEKDIMRQNRFLENYLITADEAMIAYANTSSLFRTEPKIFHNRKDKDTDIKTFHDIINIFVGMQEEHADDKKLMDSINRSFNVMYNMAKEGANITSIFAAIFYEDNIREQISIDTGVPLDELIITLVNPEDAPVIMEKIEKAQGIINYPYEPLDTANHAFPNFLYSLVQQANVSSKHAPVFGKPDLDILLLGIYNKLEQLDKEPDTEADKKAQLKALNIYGPLVEMLDKNEIADAFRDIYFRYNNPHEYEVLTTAIQNVFGMSYGQLTNHLECDIINRLDSALTPLADKYNFTYRYRVKSLYSLWEKIKKRHTILPDEDMTAAVEALLKDGFLRKEGEKERRLDDLYGMQVVFDMPHTLRSEKKMKEIQKQVLDLIDAEFSSDSATDQEFKRKEKTMDKHGYREEKIMPIWKDANGVEYRGEIQVLSDKDLKLYKHGAEAGNIQAHWGYKIKERGYHFDDEMLKLIKKLQYLYGHDSHKNFTLLSNYLKKHIFTAVYTEATAKEKAHLKYLRMPMKSIIPDVAASSSINMLHPKNAAQVLLTRDKNGQLKVEREKDVYPSSTVKPGQVFRFQEPKDPKYSFGKHKKSIVQKAQKLSTIVQVIPKESYDRDIFKGKTNLEAEMAAIVKKTAPDVNIHEFLNNATNSTLSFFRINKHADLYSLANIIEHELDHAILIRIGQHFFNDKLKQRTHITNLKTLYAALGIPKEERTPLRAFATMITADQIGKIKLHKHYRGKLEDKDDFSEIDNWSTRNALKKSAKRHGIQSLHEMRALIALNVFSPLEILMEHYNYNFSYTLRLEGKNHMMNLYNIFMELENLGIKHSPAVNYNENSVVLSLTSPSLSPSEDEQQFIKHKLDKVLPSFNVDSYQLTRPSTVNQKLVRVVPANKATTKRLKKTFDFLKIPYTNSGDGALIIKVARSIPVKIIKRLLENKLHTNRYTKRTFEISELLQEVRIKRMKVIRSAA